MLGNNVRWENEGKDKDKSMPTVGHRTSSECALRALIIFHLHQYFALLKWKTKLQGMKEKVNHMGMHTDNDREIVTKPVFL